MGSVVSKIIPALYNGQSQQSSALRLPTQTDTQINCSSSIARGVSKRPASKHLQLLSDNTMWDDEVTYPDYISDWEDAKYHLLETQTGELFFVVVTDGDLRVFDKNTGAEKTVNTPVGTSYLGIPSGTKARKKFSLMTVCAYTFVVNRTVEVETTTPPSSAPADWADWYFPEAWGAAFDQEQYYNPTTGTYADTLQSFEDLPDPRTIGDIYEITGTDKDSFSKYYVEAISTKAVTERWDYGLTGSLGLDETTMPMALVYDSVADEFILTYFPWKVRKVGDDNTNPPPSFVGQTLEDVFFYKNRLGFLAGENAIMSVAGDFGNFWRQTVTDLLDTDVVDIAVAGSQISNLRYAVPFNNTMMLFAEKGQYALNVDEILSPSTVSVDKVTSYTMDRNARPVGIGSEVYFTENRGDYSVVREYFVSDDTNATEASDVTAHVPELVPGSVLSLAGSSNHGMLAIPSADSGSSNRLSVYQFRWGSSGKTQSAWTIWEFQETNAEILFAEVVDDDMYLVVKRPDGVSLEKIVLVHKQDSGSGIEVLLDRKSNVDSSELSWTGTNTRMNLPYRIDMGDVSHYRVLRYAGRMYDPDLVTFEDTDADGFADRITFDASLGDISGSSLWVGANYTQTLQLSRQYVRAGDDAVIDGDLLLTKMTLQYKDGAHVGYAVWPYGFFGQAGVSGAYITERYYRDDAYDLGTDWFYSNAPEFHDGHMTIDIGGDTEDLVLLLQNSMPYQCYIESLEWEGFFTKRSRSI